MANQPDTNNRNYTLRMPRELFYRVQKEARERKMDMSEYVRHILNEETLDIELTPAEWEQIAKEVARAKNRLRNA